MGTTSSVAPKEGHIKENKIEFLYWEGCPSHPEALNRLRQVIAELGDQRPIQMIEVDTDQEAKELAFPGSPTIRIAGIDVDPDGAVQMGAALTCRVYLLEDGRFSPVPSLEMIRQAFLRS
jgi:hypothetical protein